MSSICLRFHPKRINFGYNCSTTIGTKTCIFIKGPFLDPQKGKNRNFVNFHFFMYDADILHSYSLD